MIERNLKKIKNSAEFSRIHTHISSDRYTAKVKQRRSTKELLDHPAHIDGPYYYKGFYSYHLCISKNYLKIYLNSIGFDHPKEKGILEYITKDGDVGTIRKPFKVEFI